MNRPDGRLIEREEELAVVASALAEARDGRGSAVLLEGEAGIGKTTLLTAACAAARVTGPRLIRARGTPLDEGAAYGVVRQLVLGGLHDSERRKRLLRGAAGLARPALLGHADGPPPGDAAFAIREGLMWLVAAMAEEGGPLALVVDDLHWADGPSARFLQGLASRIGELPVALLLAARPAPAWSDPDLAAGLRGEARVLRLARLSPEGVSSVLAGRLSVEPMAEFAGAVHAQTAGTPYLVAALADAIRREGIEPTSEQVAAIGTLDVAELGRGLATRVRGLSPEARSIVRAVAVLGDGRQGTEAERVAGVEPGDGARAASALEAAGLLRGWPEPSFDHPLVRAAVLGDVSAEERVRLHERAAELAMTAGESERAAAHLAEVPGRASPERAGVLHRVGLRALHSGAPDLAKRHLRRALAEPPPGEMRGPLLFDLGLCELGLGDDLAPDRLAAAADAAASPDHRLRALMASGHALSFLGHWDEGLDRMRTAIAGGRAAAPDALALARIELAGFMLTLIPTGREASAMLDALERELDSDARMGSLLAGVIALRDVSFGLPGTALCSGSGVRRRAHRRPRPGALSGACR